MIRELHFPTPIYIADIKHPTLNQELERDIIAWSKQDKGIVRTNVQGWHSTTNMHELPQFKKLVDTLFKTKIEASQKLGVSRQTINNWYIGKHKVPVVIINYLRQLN